MKLGSINRLLIGILAILIIFIVVSCESTPATEETGKSAQRTLSPIEIKEWSGKGTKTTESFVTSGEQWAISWVFNPDPSEFEIYANYFGIYVYRTQDDIPINVVANIANVSSGQSDISYMHESGTFYLTVNSYNGTWKFKVYDYR
jgi:hypothetical protein